MKKLTAGIFATILGLTAIDAYAAIPTQNYVDEAVGSVRTTVTQMANNIASYGDIVTHNVSEFATAAQGQKADTALQSADLNGYAKTADLGTAAFTASTAYATAAQGKTADDTAATVATYGDVVTHNASEFATAAQGQKADTALQSADLNGYAKTADVETTYETKAHASETYATQQALSGVKATADEALEGAEAANGELASLKTSLKSAAYTPTTDYATAAQGAKADTALQKVTCSNPDGCVLMADGTIQSIINKYNGEEN